MLDTRPRLLLVAFCLLCWLPGWFTIPVTDRDEARFAQASKQMIETGDFVDIRNGDVARNRKPIGIYWLQVPGAALARDLGLATANPIWPYRLPSLLGALVGVLATYGIGRSMAGSRVALLAAAMLGGSALLTVEAHIAKTDAALLGATTLAMGVLARAYLGQPVGRARAGLFWLAMGAGILLKGPITPMVAGLAALTLVAADRRAAWIGRLRPGWGVPLMLAVALPWFVAIGIATHGAFFADAIGGDLRGKLAGGDDAHGAPPGTHLLLLAVTLFPAGFAVLRALPAAWAARREPATRFLLAWAVPSWLVFEAVPTKLPHYPLPLFPALCLLGAGWLLAPARIAPWRWLATTSAALFVVACAVFGGGAVALPFVASTGRGPLDLLGAPALAAALAVGFAVLRRGTDTRRAVIGGLLAVPVLWWAILEVELPNATPLWIGPRVAAAVAADGPAAERPAADGPAAGFAAVGYAEPSLMFAMGSFTRWPDAASAARALARGGGQVVAVEAREMPDFLAACGPRAPHRFATVKGFDYSDGDRIALGLFDAR